MTIICSASCTPRRATTAIADYVAWTLATSRSLGIKVVNAGGAAAFKENVRAFSFDDVVPSYGVSSRAIVKALQHAVNALGVPHPLHVHCNNLGLAGNVETALATIAAAEGLPLHLAHLQFYGYGKEGERGFSSAAAPLADAVNAAKSVTIDVGQVMFGQTVTISSDVLRQFNARNQARPRKWVIVDGDANGVGIVPYDYRRNDFYNAVQWAIGLELFLLIEDPWRVFFTTDHPNGAPFTHLSRHFRAADEPGFAGAMDGGAAGGRDQDDDAAVDHARIFADRDRHDDPRRAGEAARLDRSRASRCRRRRRCRRLRRRRRPRQDVSRRRAMCSRTANWSCATAK